MLSVAFLSMYRANYYRSDWSKFITVQVGGSKPEFPSQTFESDYTNTKTFLVYETQFRAQSPFFESALGREWKESEERLVRLPYHDPEAFELYLRWVYSHRVILQSTKWDETEKAAACSLIARAYVLSDVLQDTDAKDALLDALVDYQEQADWTAYEEARYIYENTQSQSPIRRLLVAMVVTKDKLRPVKPPLYAQQSRKFNSVEFLCDILQSLDGDHGGPNKSINTGDSEDDCAYHEHGNNTCYRTKYRVKSL